MLEPHSHSVPVWPSDPDTAPETVEAVQAGLTVRLVMTERHRLMTCCPSDMVASLVAANVDQFSFVPVVSEGRICGLYNAERWFEKKPPSETRVEEDFDLLSEDQLIGGEVSILDYVLSAPKRPARLVVSGSEIVGMVCLADLHKLPVRAALFGLVTALEMVMTEEIQGNCSNGSQEWLALLSAKRREKAVDKIDSLRADDTFVSEILATEFADKADVVIKLGLLEGSKKGLRKEFRSIGKLRNSLAHASVFASNSVAAEKVSHTVRAILKLMDELRRGDELEARRGVAGGLGQEPS